METQPPLKEHPAPTYLIDEEFTDHGDPIVTRWNTGALSNKQAARRAGFFAAAPHEPKAPSERLEVNLKRLAEVRKELGESSTARVKEVKDQAYARVERIKVLSTECTARLSKRDERANAIKSELEAVSQTLVRLEQERKSLREQLGQRRGDAVSEQIKKAQKEIAELLAQQDELNKQRQGMFDRERAQRGPFYSGRAQFFKALATRAREARNMLEERARSLGLNTASTGLGIALTSFGMIAVYLAGEFFASIGLGSEWGASSLLDYFLQRVVTFMDQYVSYDTVWRDLGVLFGAWVAFLVLCHLLFLGTDALLTQMRPKQETDEQQKAKSDDFAVEGVSAMEVSALGFTLKQEYGTPRRLYHLWVRSLPIIFILGVMIIVTARPEALQANQTRIAAQLVGSALTVVLALLAYLLLSRSVLGSPKAVRVVQWSWLGVAVLWGALVVAALFLHLNPGVLMTSLFGISALLGAFALALALIHGELIRSARELEIKEKLALEAELYWSYPASARFLLTEEDVMRSKFVSLQASVMDTIRDRAAQVGFIFQRLVRKLVEVVTPRSADEGATKATAESMRPGPFPGSKGTGMTKAERSLFPDLHVKLEDVDQAITEATAQSEKLRESLAKHATGTDSETEILLGRIANFEKAIKNNLHNTWQSTRALRNNLDELERRFDEQEQDVREGFAIGLAYWPAIVPPTHGVVLTNNLSAHV